MMETEERKGQALFDRKFVEMMAREVLPPAGVAWVMVVGSCMALWSFLLVLVPPPYDGQDHMREKLLWIVNCDMFAIQNLGHGAFLIFLATSWWRNQNVLGLCHVNLSCAFLSSSCLGYTILAAYFSQHVTFFHHVIPAVFLTVLVCAFVTSSRMANEWNLMIFRPKLYLIQDADTLLRRVLLLQCMVECMEPILVALGRILSVDTATARREAFVNDMTSFPALTLRGFIESYTLGFHQAFIAATAYSCVLVEDRLKDPTRLLLAMFGQIILVFAFSVGGIMIPADKYFFMGIAFKVCIHATLAMLLLRSYFKTRNQRMEYQKLEEEEDDTLHQTAKQEQGGGLELSSSSPASGKSFQGVTVWEIFQVSDHPGARRLAIGVILATIFHGVCWQLQGALSIYLSFSSKVGMDKANGLRAGLNFGMHGSGISIFVMVLALRSPVSFPLLKLSVLLGALGGAAISLVQLYHIDLITSTGGVVNDVTEDSLNLLKYTTYFFVLRAAAGVLLFLLYAPLQYPSIEAIGRLQPKRLIQSSSPRRAFALIVSFCISIVIYAFCVTYLLGKAGVRAGFALNGEHADGAYFDRWHEHRLVEFPPGYGLVFHFAFLLPGFVFHYFVQEFQPSKWISVAFISSAVFLFIMQAILSNNNNYGQDRSLVLFASLLPASVGFLLLCELFTFKPGNNKTTEFLAADFWH